MTTKKFYALTAVMVLVLAMVGSGDALAAKKKGKKAPRKATTTAVAPVYNIDFRTVLEDNNGKKYNTQLMRNLMSCNEFIERAGYQNFRSVVEKLAGDVTAHNLADGTRVLMLRFGDMTQPGLEQIVFYNTATDALVTTTLLNSETWGPLKGENDAEPFLTPEDANSFYWATFTD